jgi:uncharacterized protein YciI
MVRAWPESVSGQGAARLRQGGRIVGRGSYGPGMANFAVRLMHGPNWDPGRPIRGQDGWDEHAAFMDGLVEDGFIILGGPVGDGEQTLHAVEAADEDEIRTRLALDPWASAGLLRVGPVEPWALWLDGRGLDGRGLGARVRRRGRSRQARRGRRRTCR